VPNEFRICDKCKKTNIKTLVPRLKEIDPDAIIDIRCQSFCGPGSLKNFAIVNHKAIIADNEDELIEKIKKELNK
jgi:uncharacterized protein YuzB (UPF0349 family)